MKKHIIISVFIFLIWLPVGVIGQELSNIRYAFIGAGSDTIVLDSLSVVPSSLKLTDTTGTVIPDTSYLLLPGQGLLVLNQGIVPPGGLVAEFRVFPMDFSAVRQGKDIEEVIKLGEPSGGQYIYRTDEGNDLDDFFSMQGLSKSGSISRGISFGNSQDVVVNSNFNLQLSGRLSPEIEVLAAITDNDVPVQPYGNSQVIQEFDKVFIKLTHRNASLIAGDFELTRPKGYFMNYFKKLQGGMFTGNIDLSPRQNPGKSVYNVKAAAALSKGKFARNQIQGIEGNQGPYPLTGNEGENFIIVLAGSEKVYIDGQLKTRGENFDYIIDYNSAEITFTPNVLITKDKRIVVEFEYSDRRYARSLFYAGNEVSWKRSSVYLNYYTEQDLRNQSLQQELSDADKAFLASIGDSLNQAYLPGFDSTGFTEGEIRYKLIDTVAGGVKYDTVFVFSTNPDSAVYKVGFSRVGAGNGNYIQDISSANGRVFKWVAPIDGVSQGDHRPVRTLVTPKKTQMFVAGIRQQLGVATKINGEMAISGRDLNTFSSLDGNDNAGVAVKIDVGHTFEFGSDTNGWKLHSKAAYEYVGSSFRPIERFRSVEFERDWNLLNNQPEGDQNFATLGLDLQKEGLGNILFDVNTFFIGDAYRGVNNRAAANIEVANFDVYFDGSILTTGEERQNTRFIRQKSGLSRKFKNIRVGLAQELEDNRLKYADSLLASSFSYFQWEAFFKTADTSRFPVSLTYRNRMDNLPAENALQRAFSAQDVELILRPLNKASHRLSVNATYRSLAVRDTSTTEKPPENNLVGRLEHYLRIFKGAITFNTFYEIGSGLDRKQEFYYLKVPAGEGIYAWIDYNGDGIEQLNEFEIAAFKDQANYIRVFVQSNDYVRNYYNKFTESVNINPAAVWKTSEGIRKFIARFSNQLVFRTERKSGSEDPWAAYNPFRGAADIEDTALISQSSSFRNTFYFDRINPKFSADFNILRNANKTILINGYESRRLSAYTFNLRWNFYKTLTYKTSFSTGKSNRGSEFFSANNYSLETYETEQRIIWQAGTNVRFETFYVFMQKENLIGEGDEKLWNHSAGIEFNYRILNKGNLLFKADYLRIRYNGQTSTPLAYEMLEGFLPGHNATWSVAYQQNLSRFLQLNLAYDGRKSEGAQTVHIGSVQIRAHF